MSAIGGNPDNICWYRALLGLTRTGHCTFVQSASDVICYFRQLDKRVRCRLGIDQSEKIADRFAGSLR